MFIGLTGSGAGLRIWTQASNAPGITIQNGFGGSGTPTAVTGIHVDNYLNDVPSTGITVNRIGNGPGIAIADGGSTSGNFLSMGSNTKTTDPFLNIFQNTAAYTGTVIDANVNFGVGGYFLQLANNGVPKVNIDLNGLITIGSLTFVSLGTPPNGTIVYCSDCNATCSAGSSTGKFCGRVAGAWAAF
jgi:hypothetical protein